MSQQLHKRRGHLARSRGRNQGILRFRGGRRAGASASGTSMRSLAAVPVGHAEQNGSACEAGRGIRQGGAEFAGVRRDAQAADRLVELLRLLSPRVFAGTLEEDFEFGGNFSHAVFEKLAGAGRHC